MGSKTFKINDKKLKLTRKLKNTKNFPKYQEKFFSDPYFWLCQHFFGKNYKKWPSLIIQKFIENDSDIVYEWLLLITKYGGYAL